MQTLKSVTYNARLTRITEASGSCLLSVLYLRLYIDTCSPDSNPLDLFAEAKRVLSPDMYFEATYLHATSHSTFFMIMNDVIGEYNKIVFNVTPGEVAGHPFIADIVNKLNLESWSSIEFNPQDDELTFVDAIESAL